MAGSGGRKKGTGSRPRRGPGSTWIAAVAGVAVLAVLIAIWFGSGNPSGPPEPQAGQGTPAPGAAGTSGVPHEGGRQLGPANAPVVVEMYSDFQCPHCATASRQVLPALFRDYVDTGKVRFVARFYPFLGSASVVAAEAAACADRQGKFWPYHDRLFQFTETGRTNQFTPSGLERVARELGLDTAAFQSCLRKHETRQEVQSDLSQGKRLGVEATPTFFINGVKLEGAYPYEEIRRLVETALRETAR